MQDLLLMQPSLNKQTLNNAILITSNDCGIKEEALIRLCILNAGMGGLSVIGGNNRDGSDMIEFIRGIYRRLKQKENKELKLKQTNN